MKKLIVFCITCLLLTGCVIQEEFRFDKDASGEYSIAFNMDALMGLGGDDEKEDEIIDTVVTFASFLDEKKDSIAKLPKEEREKLELLRPLTFSMNVNDSLQKMDMRMSYKFKTLDDIENFSEAVNTANIKELNDMGFGGSESDTTSTEGTDIGKTSEDLFGSANAYTTKFSKKRFSRIIKPESRAELIAKRDTSESSFADAIVLRQIYKFPYKIKSVDNPLAKIHADFKGVEVEANMMQLNNNPDIFNIEVKFER